MIDFVTDKRFLVGLAAGWFVVPYITRFVTMRMSAGAAVSANGA